MTHLKLALRIVIVAIVCLHAVTHGQVLNRRQQQEIFRQQQELEKQQELLEQQLLSQTSQSNLPSLDLSQQPINHAILESIFNVPLQAIRAVNDLVRTLVAIKARLNLIPKQTATGLTDVVN